ncbi:hypothetical protein BX666DRAFT_1873854 [Dichotomocladium elegans]|nr:hypothetical protein BX666DRAFT_1873854 [Dichotomocladium elegans]
MAIVTTLDTAAGCWHTQSVDAVVAFLETNLKTGLTDAEVAARQAQYGINALADANGHVWLKILLRQLMDVMNWVFVALGVVCYVLKDYITGTLLIAVGIFNTGLGYSQEYAAERTLAALRDLSSPMATVLRNNGDVITVPSEALVPGDILLIQEGNTVPADARLVADVTNLEMDEALLTGESVPVQKQLVVLERPDEPLGDRINMVYSSTIATKGRAKAVVTATGMATEIGKVAQQLGKKAMADRTRMQESLNKMYVYLSFLAILLALIVLASVRFKVNYDIGMYAMTAALSVLPAGLTTVLTVTLVLGGKEMAKHKALVRKLKCLETLGSVTNIFSDKTGTLTLAKMVVVRCWTLGDGHFRVESRGVVPQGEVYKIQTDGCEVCVDGSKHLRDLATAAALCNGASLHYRPEKEAMQDNSDDDDDGDARAVTNGGPTEVALQVFASKCGWGKSTLEGQEGWEFVCEFPFDSNVKRMTTVYRHGPTSETQAFVKGAVEWVLPLCGGESEKTQLILDTAEALASQGLRVIAFATRVLKSEVGRRDQVETDLRFVGLAGIYDPPRPETRQAVLEAHRAGIMVHMLTGDHPATAVAMAREVCILKCTESVAEQEGLVMTGPQFDGLTDDQVDRLPRLPLVVARCSPETKVKMIHAAQRRKFISAMTGDGVNDAPSLKIADVGIAMGKNGSDVARAASAMILTDDNFATIIRAIAEGRRIYQNMQRFLLYFYAILFSCALLIVVGLAVRDPAGRSAAPISTLEMLFLYVVVTPPAGLLSVQRASPDVMKEPPRSPTESIFNREIILDSLAYSVALAVLSLVAYLVPLFVHGGIQGVDCDGNYQVGLCDAFFRGRATLLVTYTLSSVVIMAHCRSYRRIEWDMRGLRETFRSQTIIATLAFDFLCFGLFLYIPRVATQGFRILGITWEWALVIVLVFLLIAIGEGHKWVKRKLLRPLAAHPVDELLF